VRKRHVYLNISVVLRATGRRAGKGLAQLSLQRNCTANLTCTLAAQTRCLSHWMWVQSRCIIQVPITYHFCLYILAGPHLLAILMEVHRLPIHHPSVRHHCRYRHRDWVQMLHMEWKMVLCKWITPVLLRHGNELTSLRGLGDVHQLLKRCLISSVRPTCRWWCGRRCGRRHLVVTSREICWVYISNIRSICSYVNGAGTHWYSGSIQVVLQLENFTQGVGCEIVIPFVIVIDFCRYGKMLNSKWG